MYAYRAIRRRAREYCSFRPLPSSRFARSLILILFALYPGEQNDWLRKTRGKDIRIRHIIHALY